MKVTKSYLKELIKEELRKISEVAPADTYNVPSEDYTPKPTKQGTKVLEVSTEDGVKYFLEASAPQGYLEVWAVWDSEGRQLNIRAMNRSKLLDLKYDAANQLGAEVD